MVKVMSWNPKNDLPPIGHSRSSYNRPQRVADMIKNEISLLLVSKLRDPRLSNVTILQVIVTKDLRRAKVFFSVLGEEKKVLEANSGLSSAKGFIRSHLARVLGLRVTPELSFQHDLSMVHQEEMERLLKEIRSDDTAD